MKALADVYYASRPDVVFGLSCSPGTSFILLIFHLIYTMFKHRGSNCFSQAHYQDRLTIDGYH